MTNPAWMHLASAYQRALLRLFRGRLPELIAHPELANEPEFRRATERLARQMVGGVAQATARSWRQAAMKATNSRRMLGSLQTELAGTGFQFEQLALRNAELIRSLPREIAEIATERATRAAQRGGRPLEIERSLHALAPGITKWKVKLIARTEVSRATTDVTRTRSERLGLNWYQWATSNDARVRASHRAMDQVLVEWNDTPAPERLAGEHSTLGAYHAGCCPNCRCEPLVVASLDEIRWPAKVHRAGRIVRMSRAEFTRVIGISLAA